jgi:sugar (pentulose or hexulose) kinase
MSIIQGYLGIDNGTQGLSVVFTDEELRVLATGEGSYEFVPNLLEGCYEQRCEDWDAALSKAMDCLRHKLIPRIPEILSIGISGQMHGEVCLDGEGSPVSSVRLWCDARNDKEGTELTELFQTKIPKRATVARWLWTCRNQPEKATETKHLTTPAGYLSYRLTGKFTLGIGDSAGMFPVDSSALTFDQSKLELFDELLQGQKLPSLKTLLPIVCKAGEDSGSLSVAGADLLGISVCSGGNIPVAAAEGDQVAALAGSLIGSAGTVSCSFGTSVCANSISELDRVFQGVSKAVDHFCAADGKPIHMIWLRNGTTFLNTMVKSYGGREFDAFDTVMPELIRASVDCGGLLALPFMDDEPGLGVLEGGSALILGLNPENSTAGNIAKAALLSTIFNLKLGCNVLDEQGYARTEIVLTGGLTKTPECGQILADVFNVPVSLLASSDEGCSWGAAVLAKFRHLCFVGKQTQHDFTSFLDSVSTSFGASKTCFTPNQEHVPLYTTLFGRYKNLVALQPQLAKV